MVSVSAELGGTAPDATASVAAADDHVSSALTCSRAP